MSIAASIIVTIPVHGFSEEAEPFEYVVINDGAGEVTIPAQDFVAIADNVFRALAGEDEQDQEQGAAALDLDEQIEDGDQPRPRLVVKRSAVSMD